MAFNPSLLPNVHDFSVYPLAFIGSFGLSLLDRNGVFYNMNLINKWILSSVSDQYYEKYAKHMVLRAV